MATNGGIDDKWTDGPNFLECGGLRYIDPWTHGSCLGNRDVESRCEGGGRGRGEISNGRVDSVG